MQALRNSVAPHMERRTAWKQIRESLDSEVHVSSRSEGSFRFWRQALYRLNAIEVREQDHALSALICGASFPLLLNIPVGYAQPVRDQGPIRHSKFSKKTMSIVITAINACSQTAKNAGHSKTPETATSEDHHVASDGTVLLP
jgi:hypothetical protein